MGQPKISFIALMKLSLQNLKFSTIEMIKMKILQAFKIFNFLNNLKQLIAMEAYGEKLTFVNLKSTKLKSSAKYFKKLNK